MKIALGADHGGFELKELIKKYLQTEDYSAHEIIDCGPLSLDGKDDYPKYGKMVVDGIVSGEYDRGILICTMGHGMCMVGNKGRGKFGARAANCRDVEDAMVSRQHNDANILVMGAKKVPENLAYQIVDTFLTTEFSDEERHIRRVKMLDEM